MRSVVWYRVPVVRMCLCAFFSLSFVRHLRPSSIFSCRPIVHGMLYSSLFGTIFGASIPGAIYLSQTFKFKAPVYVGETISAKIEVTGVRTKPFHAATCSTKIVRENGEVCTEGEAVVMLPEPTSGEKKEEIKTAAAENPLR